MPTTSSGDYFLYTARAGDTWDQISYMAYMYTERYADLVLKANPEYSDVVIFEGGEVVKVPIVDTVDTPETLPPWRHDE